MTDEEAIKGLQNIVEYWTLHPHEQECAETAISALRERIDRRHPQPLTDEELECMGKEPVYFTSAGEAFWRLSRNGYDYVDELDAMRSERPANAYSTKPQPPEQEDR